MYSDMCNISFLGDTETIVSTVGRVVHEKVSCKAMMSFSFCMLCDSSSSVKDCTKNPFNVVLKCFMLPLCC